MALLCEMIYSLDVDTLIFIFCSVLASGDFRRLRIAVANSLDPDHRIDRMSVLIWIQTV